MVLLLRIFNQINQAMSIVKRAMKQSSQLVTAGRNESISAGEALDEIQSSISEAQEMAQEITQYVDEQLNYNNKISAAVKGVSEISSRNAAGAQETASVNQEQANLVEEISQIADQLNNMVDNLRNIFKEFQIS